MLIYVPTLNLIKFLQEKKMLKLSNNEFDFIIMIDLDIQSHSGFVHKKYILNRINNTKYDVYFNQECKGTLKSFRQKIQG